MSAAAPRALLVAVRFHDGRYHGVGADGAGEWPPSPMRLFQALVAGAARGGELDDTDRAALAWLETLAPPTIAAPVSREGQGLRSYVPNNDLDAVGGDPVRAPEIRAPKSIRPRLFDAAVPTLYRWSFADGEAHAAAVCRLAERLYQLGRGVDMAYAVGEVLEAAAADASVDRHPGARFRPSAGGAGDALPCPTHGSLASLEERFRRMRGRFTAEVHGRIRRQLFAQPPKPRFAMQAYESPPTRLLYELRDIGDADRFVPQPQAGIVELVERVRDTAAARLTDAMKDSAKEPARLIERVLIGRGAGEADKQARLRILPLPSIGHAAVGRSIRRLLVEIPPSCPIPAAAVDDAFAGLEPHDPETGELRGWMLVGAGDWRMAEHYGIVRALPARVWRTVTPAALPERAARRRIDPARIRDEAKAGAERAVEEGRAAAAVLQALRHAGIEGTVDTIRVQREPFAARGARAEVFAHGPRFPKERLWHVEIAFAEPRTGPVVIGDGRYLGLGLMAPEPAAQRLVAAYAIEAETPLPPEARSDLLAAIRRALMATDRDLARDGRVSRLFSGHEPDGTPAGDGAHRHVFLAAVGSDGAALDRLYVFRPDAVDRAGRPHWSDAQRFERVTAALRQVRAGRLGVLGLLPLPPAEDRVLATAAVWTSVTPYRPTRLPGRGKDPAAWVLSDVAGECRRRGLPAPRAELLELQAGPRGGNVSARLRLTFARAVAGPVLLGRDSHQGGGLFAAADPPDATA